MIKTAGIKNPDVLTHLRIRFSWLKTELVLIFNNQNLVKVCKKLLTVISCSLLFSY